MKEETEKAAAADAIRPHVRRSQRVADALRHHLLQRFRPGSVLPPERLLAEQLSTSRMTLRQAIGQLIGEGWLKRQRGRSAVVARPRRRPFRSSGFLFSYHASVLLRQPFYRRVLAGLHEVAIARHRNLLYMFAALASLRRMPPTLANLPNIRTVDSLVTLELFDAPILEELGMLCPVVALDVACRAPNVSSICFDHHRNVQMGVKYLYDVGHRRIALHSRPLPSVDPAVSGRYEAFREAMQWAGLGTEPRWLLQGTATVVAQRIAEAPAAVRPTALFTMDNCYAIALELAARGVRVPRDISLLELGTGESITDVLDLLYRTLHPKETPTDEALRAFYRRLPAFLLRMMPALVRMPTEQMGKTGMEEVFYRLANPSAAPRMHTLVGELIPGNTTAPPPDQ